MAEIQWRTPSLQTAYFSPWKVDNVGDLLINPFGEAFIFEAVSYGWRFFRSIDDPEIKFIWKDEDTGAFLGQSMEGHWNFLPETEIGYLWEERVRLELGDG